MVDKAHTEKIEEQAALLALGALPVDEASQFRRRLDSGCPVCQAAFSEFQNTAALLPFAAPEVSPPDRLRTRLMERVAETAVSSEPAPRAGAIVRADQTPWQQTPVPGLQVRKLLGENTILVRMAPGTVYPKHDHKLAEQCLVLEGSVESEGVQVQAGDFTYMPAGSSHAPLYTKDGCLLLIAYA